MSLLTCENVSLGYEGKTVVENLNFTVESGDYLCILGENGSGKSTLMKTLLGLKTPMSGAITLGDGLKHNEIGYLPQQTIVQRDFPASVKEIVLSGFLNHSGLRPFYNKEEKQLAKDNMKRLGIYELRKSCYRDLSGGQQQRVLLARALCATTKMLLLDEPVAGLDPKVTIEMYELISSINKGNKDENKEPITIIMVSHDVQAALNYATKILHVSDTPEFFDSKEAYLDSKIGKQFTNVQEDKYINE
ncbi:MAG: metal ABC transporter ATP-binding protein [Lachnospiraceae bacterium]|nr:metal ABC transporter ATP-binding protein [Lachnospiraceae bacterium]MBQ8318528.1 metal ABC transporter ATP-binding protein [Lachnospiraceae bacterium]